jgi:hypothetical protein
MTGSHALTHSVKEREDIDERRAADGPGQVQPNDAGAKHDETQCHRLLPSDAITQESIATCHLGFNTLIIPRSN